MVQNNSESKSELKTYVIYPAWHGFDTKRKFQRLVKSCSRMSQKARMEWKLDNILIIN